jgi:hypothetical protein
MGRFPAHADSASISSILMLLECPSDTTVRHLLLCLREISWHGAERQRAARVWLAALWFKIGWARELFDVCQDCYI